MKFLKEKKGIIISFIIGVIIASSITVYAYSYVAKDITYKDGKSVEYALNDLYKRIGTFNVEAYVFGGITSYGTDNSNIIERANSSDTNYFTTSNGNVNYLNINIMKNMHIKILLRSMARGGDFNNTISINNEVKRTYANNDYDDAIIEYEVDVSNGDIVKITQDTVSGGARCLSIFVVGTSI